jgi:hypothetical protein
MARGSVPVPDPTVLTTKLTEREIAALRELLDARITALKNTVETRLDGMDKALLPVQAATQRLVDLVLGLEDKLAGRVDEKLTAYANVVHEKFHGIEVRFSERDTRFESEKRDSKTAVDAALQAAKEAVGKSELSTVKQIDQQGILINTTTKATDEKIDDIKDRITRIEGMGLGRAQQYGQWIVGAGLLVAMAVLVSKYL